MTRSPNANDGPNVIDNPDASDNSIFQNLMLADLVQALGLCTLPLFSCRNLISGLLLLGSLAIIKWMVDGVRKTGLCVFEMNTY